MEKLHCPISQCCHKTIRRSQCHTPQSEILHLLRPPQNFWEKNDGSVQHPCRRPADRDVATDCRNINIYELFCTSKRCVQLPFLYQMQMHPYRKVPKQRRRIRMNLEIDEFTGNTTEQAHNESYWLGEVTAMGDTSVASASRCPEFALTGWVLW